MRLIQILHSNVHMITECTRLIQTEKYIVHLIVKEGLHFFLARLRKF